MSSRPQPTVKPDSDALGVFELLTIRDPALHAPVRDEPTAQKPPRHLSVVASRADDGRCVKLRPGDGPNLRRNIATKALGLATIGQWIPCAAP